MDGGRAQNSRVRIRNRADDARFMSKSIVILYLGSYLSTWAVWCAMASPGFAETQQFTFPTNLLASS